MHITPLLAHNAPKFLLFLAQISATLQVGAKIRYKLKRSFSKVKIEVKIRNATLCSSIFIFWANVFFFQNEEALVCNEQPSTLYMAWPVTLPHSSQVKYSRTTTDQSKVLYWKSLLTLGLTSLPYAYIREYSPLNLTSMIMEFSRPHETTKLK